MRLTDNNKGLPVFMTHGGEISYAEGIKRIKRINGLTAEELGRILGVSRRTVEGWIDGRRPGLKRLLFLKNRVDKFGYLRKDKEV